MTTFNSQYNIVKHSAPETFEDAVSKVDMIGYIPKERQIAMLIQAGERLVNHRGVYDFAANQDVDIDEHPVDPTRSKSFDLADASEVMKGKQINNIIPETGEYIDHKGVIRNIKHPDAKSKQGVPDTTSRSVSGQMTPLESGEPLEKLDKTNKKGE